MLLPNAKTIKIKEQIIDDRATGLMLVFRLTPSGESRLHLVGDILRFGNRDFQFDGDGELDIKLVRHLPQYGRIKSRNSSLGTKGVEPFEKRPKPIESSLLKKSHRMGRLAVPSTNGAFNIKILDPACGSGSFLTYTREEKQTIDASPAKTVS